MGDLVFRADPRAYIHEGGIILPGVTTLLKSQKMISLFPTQRDLDFGNAVHLTTQYHDQGDLDIRSVMPSVLPRLEAWIKFCEIEEFVHDPEYIELPVHSDLYSFATIVDRCGFLRLFPAIVEIKSGAHQAWWALQLAAQKECLSGTTYGGPSVRRIAVELRADGTYKKHEFHEISDRPVFMSIASIYHWKPNHGYKHGGEYNAN